VSAPLPELIQSLLRPDAYPHEAGDIQLIQTHISYVVLAGAYAYKIKKPLDLHFLDYSTLERRRLMCEEEVRLNRRLCPEAYLGVEPIVRRDGGYRVGGEGEALEYAVKMRRMPEEAMMPAMLARGAVTEADIRRIAGMLAAFHATSASDERTARFGSADSLRANWDENFEQTAPFIGRTITLAQHELMRGYVDRFLRGRAALIEERAASGRVRDCHGDLRSDSIVIHPDGGICVMDCIEFNDRIRYGDVAGDVGFLAMDLDFRGRPDLADELMSAYLNAVDDETLPCVLDFYRAYRAYVRGKVESMQMDEPEVSDAGRAAALERATAYFALAQGYAEQPPARTLVVMSGLSGSGKSYVGAAVASRLGAAFLRSDTTRQRIFSVPGEGRHAEAYGSGIYTEESRARVYEALHQRAAQQLRLGLPVVLDATYSRVADRAAAMRIAGETATPALVLHVAADEETVRGRMVQRAEEPAGASDARWETYLAQRERFEAPDEVPSDRLVRIDGAAPLRQSVERALEAVANLVR
jgi:aminoglycoside phosphotransferase family enzyme/predicted kinase